MTKLRRSLEKDAALQSKETQSETQRLAFPKIHWMQEAPHEKLQARARILEAQLLDSYQPRPTKSAHKYQALNQMLSPMEVAYLIKNS